jgi:glycosyltransferase involved in cell wall biosynthesis
MSKPVFTISCPIDTYSGYGARSRDLVKAIIKLNKYDVKILSQRWGNTRFGYLQDHNEEDLLSRIINKVENPPEYWMQITVPNEFQRVGKFNIGCTAGMETTLVAAPWVEGCNRMDLILTSSNHSKQVFLETAFNAINKQTKEESTLKINTPIEVVFEGVDISKYFEKKSTFDLESIKESFCYLFVGHWMQGDFGHDRKNVGYTIKTFLETFKNKPNTPALILKSSTVNSSLLDQERMLKKIDLIRKSVKGKLPNIYILHGDLTDAEMNELYNHPKVKVMVSHTKGEGFGRPLLEFTTTGKPIIASGWSGQLDFLNKEDSILLGGELENVHRSAAQKDMILEQAKWFKPNDQEVSKAYKESFKNYKQFIVPAKKQRRKILSSFTFDKMCELVDSIFTNTNLVKEVPFQVELELPKLELPKL